MYRIFGGKKLTPTTCKIENVLLTSKLHVEYGVFAGDYRVFCDDVVFWVTFSSVALMIPVLFVGCPRIVSNLHCHLGRREERVSDFLIQNVVLWDMYRKLNTPS